MSDSWTITVGAMLGMMCRQTVRNVDEPDAAAVTM